MRRLILNLGFLFGWAILSPIALCNSPLLVPKTNPSLALPCDFVGVQEFYRIHLQSMDRLNPERVYPYQLNAPRDVERVVRAIEQEAQWVRDQKLDGAKYAKDYSAAEFDDAFIPLLYQYLSVWGEPVSEQELQQERLLRQKQLTGPDRLIAKQLFVEFDEDSDRDAAQQAAQDLLKRLEGEDFHSVARDYYLSIGLRFNGELGVLRRGDIPDRNFDLFWQAPWLGRPYGPIEATGGFLILQVDERIPEGLAPIESVREQLERWARRRRSKQIVERYQTWMEPRLGVERVETFRSGILPEPDEPLYRIQQKEVTCREVLDRYPQIRGNPKDPRFYYSLREKAILADLILSGTAQSEVRTSLEYRCLADAYRNAWLMDRYLSTRFEKIEDSEEAVKQFWQEQLDRRYRFPDRVALTVVRIPYESGTSADPVDRRLAKKERFVLAKRLRELFLGACANEVDRLAEENRVQIEPPGELKTLSSYGHLIESAVYPLAPGELTPVLVDDTGYVFCRLEKREKETPKDYSAMRDTVRLEYLFSERQKIREEVYGFSLDLDGVIP